MSDRIDRAVERNIKGKTDAASNGATSIPQTGMIPGSGRRRRWSRADKARIVGESLKRATSVSEVARRHGLNPGQLSGWRRKARAVIGRSTALPGKAGPVGLRSEGPRPAAAPAAFAPVVITAPPLRPAASATSVVEIAIGEVSALIAAARADHAAAVAERNAISAEHDELAARYHKLETSNQKG